MDQDQPHQLRHPGHILLSSQPIIITYYKVCMFALSRVLYRSTFVAKMSQNLKRAQRLRNNIDEGCYRAEVEAKLRRKVSTESAVDEMEKEMRQEIARSLKSSELRLLGSILQAQQRREHLLGRKTSSAEIEAYNQMVKQCEKLRWQFMVHRQAVGFTIQNHQLCMQNYPIPARL